jgi:hypothetical protein
MEKLAQGLEGRIPFLDSKKLNLKQKQLFEKLNSTFVKKVKSLRIESKDEDLTFDCAARNGVANFPTVNLVESKGSSP